MSWAPDAIETARLLLRRPRADDADAIFARFASDPDVTRFVGWPRHRAIDDTRGFLEFSDHEWAKSPAGPYLIFARDDGRLLGSTGLIFETPYRAGTGYVVAKAEWGRGYATEAGGAAMRHVLETLGRPRVVAIIDPGNEPSKRVVGRLGMHYESRVTGEQLGHRRPEIVVDLFARET
jgi:ribosomal-protein-alanine N-acetyltransferase